MARKSAMTSLVFLAFPVVDYAWTSFLNLGINNRYLYMVFVSQSSTLCERNTRLIQWLGSFSKNVSIVREYAIIVFLRSYFPLLDKKGYITTFHCFTVYIESILINSRLCFRQYIWYGSHFQFFPRNWDADT